MPPPKRVNYGKFKDRAKVPDLPSFKDAAYSAKAAEQMFGKPKPGSVGKGVFGSAYERVKNNFGGDENVETDTGLTSFPDEVFKQDPTRSSNPPRPRTLRAGWIRPKGSDTGSVIVQFREGAVFEYSNVPYNVWRQMRRVASPGKALDRPNGLIGQNPRGRTVVGNYPCRKVSG